MNKVPGTQGYEAGVERFIKVSRSLRFESTYPGFVTFLPKRPAKVLDVGCGIGQNAAALAKLGYSVTALEPFERFISAAQNIYRDSSVRWMQDSLPSLELLGSSGPFDFILMAAVWQHLDEEERRDAMDTVASLAAPGCHVAMSLRNGPAGLGSRVFPIDVDRTIGDASARGFSRVYLERDRPSILPNKVGVRWAYLVLRADKNLRHSPR